MEERGLAGSVRSDQRQCLTRSNRELVDVEHRSRIATDHDAVDYRDVAACVREVSDGRAFRLLEALAAVLADELLARFPVERVEVRVVKPEVELDPPVEHAAVSAVRERA